MMQRASSSFRPLLVLLCLVGTQAKRLAFLFNPEGANCKSGTFDVNIDLAKVLCTSGKNICRPGDEVIVEGHMEVGNFLPIDITQRVRACKFFGSVCTPVLDYSQDTLEETWHLYSMYGNNTAPNKGFYGFERRFTWPDNAMTDYPWAGFTFNLVADIQADDAGNDWTHLRCHAPFTTVDYDTYKEYGTTGSGFSSTFGKWSFVGLVGVGAYAGLMQRRRRLRAGTPAIDLSDFTEAGCTNFEMMGSSTNTGGEDESVRV